MSRTPPCTPAPGRRTPRAAVAAGLLALAARVSAGDAASLSLFHGPDDTGSMDLKALRIALDGRELPLPELRNDTDPEKAIFSGQVPAGPHKLEVEAALESGSSVFSYMDGYRVKLRSLLDVEILPGEGVSIRSRIVPRGGIGTPWQERNKLVLTLSAREPAPAPPAEVAMAAAPPTPAPEAAAPDSAAVPPEKDAAAEPVRSDAPTRQPEPAATPVRTAAAPEEAPAAEPAEPAPEPAAEPAPAAKPARAATRPPRREVAAAERAPAAEPAEPAPEPAAEPAPAAKPARATRVASAPPRTTPEPSEPPAPATRAASAPTAAGDCALEPIRFGFDSAALTPAARDALDRFSGCLAATRVRVRVEGHTDAVGTDEYNRWLGWDRAAAVSSYLREHGLPNRRVTTRFVGKSRPLCGEMTAECHAQNRRVEVVPAR